MAMTSEPPPPSYDSLTPYHRNGNPFDDNENLPASVQLSRAIPLDHADSSTPILQADRFLIPSATAHNLSFSSIPPPTLSHLIPAYEWAAFTTSLSAATALSSGQKAKVIAAGVSVGIVSCWPRVGTCVGRAVWRKEVEKMIPMQGGNFGNENAAEKENVGAVLERWNRVWGAKGVRVGLMLPGMDADEECQTARQCSGGCNSARFRQGTRGYDTCGQSCDQNRCQRHGSGHARCGRRRSGCEQPSTRACGQRQKLSNMQECGVCRSCQNRRICARTQQKGCCGKGRRFRLLVERISEGEDMDTGAVSHQEYGIEDCLEQDFSALTIGVTGDKKI